MGAVLELVREVGYYKPPHCLFFLNPGYGFLAIKIKHHD